ncbi:MAG: cytochrome c3 family protein [Planctomycetota bacterium]|jgi:hypothetical protein
MQKCDTLRLALAVSLAIGAITLLGCTPASDSEPASINMATPVENEPEASSGPPPLVVDTSEPLLLEEPPEQQAAAAGTQAAIENMACFVCHGNYRDESLADSHAKANIGCVSCHGDSFAHRNDENNTTPPEKMYPILKIDSFCQSCHQAHNVPPRKVVARWKERGIDKSDPARIVCTDCHGDHRMKVRTVIWDKETGKLLRTNRGD